MSQLIKLLRSASRVTGRPAAGFGARAEGQERRMILVAALDGADAAAAKKAVSAGADAIEVPVADAKTIDKLKDFVGAFDAPAGVALMGAVPPDFDFKKLDVDGVDYVKVEAGDVPAAVFLLEKAAVILEVKEAFSDTMLKMLNFLPAKAVQVDAPEDVSGLTVKRLMEARVDRELIGKPLLMKVGAAVKPEAAQLLALISPNGLVVPAADVAAWKKAVAEIKEAPLEADESASNISLRAPAA